MKTTIALLLIALAYLTGQNHGRRLGLQDALAAIQRAGEVHYADIARGDPDEPPAEDDDAVIAAMPEEE